MIKDSDIKILEITDYRFVDIIYKNTHKWNKSAQTIIQDYKYNNTILYKYLKLNGIYGKPNEQMLLRLIKNHNIDPVTFCYIGDYPKIDELVIHLRTGDSVSKNWFLKKKYVKLIKNFIDNYPEITNITFVTAFAYQTWSDNINSQLNFTKEKQHKNENKLNRLLLKISSCFPAFEIKIVSNTDIDKDICYCVLSKYFISDFGEFSNTLKKLNELNNTQNFIQ